MLTKEALANARERNSKFIEQKVRDAIDAVVAEGRKPSFYSISTRAQVARSTLYRNPQLRLLVETARDRAMQAKRPVNSELDLLKEKIAELRDKVQSLEGELHVARSLRRVADATSEKNQEYAIIALARAA